VLSQLAKLLSNPKKYVPVARDVALKHLAPLFQNAGMFFQSQMDIHPSALWRTPLGDVTGGFFPPADGLTREISNLDAYDNTRRDMLILLLRTLIARNVPGAFAELGVYPGQTARLVHHYAPERALHLFDTFEGFTDRSAHPEAESTGLTVRPDEFSDTSVELVLRNIQPRNNNILVHKGFFPDSIPSDMDAQTFAFVHLDADLYEPIVEGLRYFYPRLAPHGVLVVHDYNSWPGARKAVDEFFSDKPEMPIPMPDKSGSALIVRQS
jgi:O-methyltransferase